MLCSESRQYLQFISQNQYLSSHVSTFVLYVNSIVICRRFGTWPVAMLAQSKNKATFEGPVCNGSQLIGWRTIEKSKRLLRFHVDMSGFAFNSTILLGPKEVTASDFRCHQATWYSERGISRMPHFILPWYISNYTPNLTFKLSLICQIRKNAVNF